MFAGTHSLREVLPKRDNSMQAPSSAQYPTVSQDCGWNTASDFQDTSREIHTSGAETRAAIAFPKAWLFPKGAKRNRTPHMLVYSPVHLGKG